jgi:WD40 repeat protein
MTVTDRPIARGASAADLIARHRELLNQIPSFGTRPHDSRIDELDAFIHGVYESGVFIAGDTDRRMCQSIIDYWTAVLYRSGRSPDDLLLLDFDPAQAPELPPEACPYVGLEAFDDQSANRFFGRQQMVATLLGQLERTPLLAVVGPSGGGKSSLVRAGLLPALRSGRIEGSESWHYVGPIVPSEAPLEALVRSFAPSGTAETTEAWVSERIDRLCSDPTTLARLMDGPVPVLLVVDQFEELFVRRGLTVDLTNDGRAFIANLVGLVQHPGGLQPRVVLTMRVDFESYLQLAPELATLFREGRVSLPGLSPGELREAIEKPAEQAGLVFEDGIVDDLIRGVAAEPSALPLLQFTLLKLWEARDRNCITWRVYESVIADPFESATNGGVETATDHRGPRWVLKHAADVLYKRDLLPEEQPAARFILTQLVRPAEGSEFVSRRLSRRALLRSGGPAADRVDRVLNKLIDARLVRQAGGTSPDDQLVEIAHEALVRNWPQLEEWLDHERDKHRDRIHLSAAAIAWQRRDKDRNALWRGAPLGQARKFDDLSPIEKEFVDTSRRFEVVANVGVALAFGLALAAVAATVWLYIVGLTNDNERLRIERELEAKQAQLRTSLMLAAEGRGHVREQLDLAMLLGLQAYSADSSTPESRALLWRVGIENPQLQRFLRSDADLETAAVGFRLDGSTVVAAHTAAQLSIWNDTGNAAVQKHNLSGTDDVKLAALSPDAERVVAASSSGRLAVWNTAAPEKPIVVDVALVGPDVPTNSRDGTTITHLAVADSGLVAVSIEDRVLVWDPALGAHATGIGRGQGDVGALAISRDGTRVAWSTLCASRVSTEGDCTPVIRVRALADSDGSESVRGGHRLDVTALKFNPNGTVLASASIDSGQLWDLGRGGNTPFTPDGATVSLQFSTDGGYLAAGNAAGRVGLWTAATGSAVGLPLDSRTNKRVLSLAFNADGSSLATAYETAGAPVIVWDMLRRERVSIARGGPRRAPANLHVQSADGRWDAHASCALPTLLRLGGSATVESCRKAQISVLDTFNNRPVNLFGHTAAVTGLAYSPDGVLASVSADGSVLLWDPATGQSLGPALEAIAGNTTGIAFENNTLVVGDDTWTLVWDLDLSIEPFAQTSQRLCSIVNREFLPEERERFRLSESQDVCRDVLQRSQESNP